MGGDRSLTRRQALSAALVGLTPKADRPIAGGFLDNSDRIGHQLRDKVQLPVPRETIRAPIVIVGGGIAGLSAAWRLHRRGFRDFVLLELEKQVGGNARWGENEITPYPWAAHYLPVPGPNATLVRALCADLGLLSDGVWNERHLCHSPQERLFIHGRWQPGIVPELAATAKDREQMRRFDERMAEFRATGQFTIPVALGASVSSRLPLANARGSEALILSRDREGAVATLSVLDNLSMSAWLTQQGFDSPYLNWYVDYACRDDYGAHAAETSAWAGIHYFASREAEEHGPLTWPEGNGWIVRRLLERLGPFVRTGSMVYRIESHRSSFSVSTTSTRYLAEAVIFAAPLFLASYVIDGAPRFPIVYSPWLTANLTLERWPGERRSEPAWDNVIYGSPSLGYVVATHQSLRTHIDRTVWTYYWALADDTPQANRMRLLSTPWNVWKEAILNDLSRAHPDIRPAVSRIDILRLGHAMARPTPGSMFAPWRRTLNRRTDGLYYAHADLTGFSIFEEALYHGTDAADRALKRLSR